MDRIKTIEAYILKNFLPDQSQLKRDEPLFSAGAIDSLGVLQLISFLEKEFKIYIDTQKHELREFDNLVLIDSLVEKLSANAK